MRHPHLSGVGLVLLFGLGACIASDDDAAPDPSPASSSAIPTTTTTVGGSEGCGLPVPERDSDRLVQATIESSGGTRSFLVYVPDGYDPDVPAPVAYVFHGATSNKEQQLAYSHYQPYADEDGALLVLPDSLGEPTRWSPFGPGIAGVEGVNDLDFFDDLSARIEADLCVDLERVLVSGMSSGGFMAASVACSRSDRITAAGPVTATAPVDTLCPESGPVAYAYFHGTADAVVAYEGGAGTPGPVEETSQGWADNNGCRGEPTDEPIGTEVVHRAWAGCDASTDLYIVEGGGHTWPGAIALGGFGYTTDDIDASEIIWKVFRSAWPDRA